MGKKEKKTNRNVDLQRLRRCGEFPEKQGPTGWVALYNASLKYISRWIFFLPKAGLSLHSSHTGELTQQSRT